MCFSFFLGHSCWGFMNSISHFKEPTLIFSTLYIYIYFLNFALNSMFLPFFGFLVWCSLIFWDRCLDHCHFILLFSFVIKATILLSKQAINSNPQFSDICIFYWSYFVSPLWFFGPLGYLNTYFLFYKYKMGFCIFCCC